MSASSHPRIRVLLRQHDDGLSAAEIAEKLNTKPDTVRNALKDMPDTYIDRWTEAKLQAPTEAIWCVVTPPEDCPKPERNEDDRR